MSTTKPCPAELPPVCPQICRAPPPPPLPLPKPVMRNLHWTQTKHVFGSACLLGVAFFAAATYFFTMPRIAKYAEFHATAELDKWAVEMAKRNLFQATPPAHPDDYPHMTYRPF